MMITVGCILVLYNPKWELSEKVIENLLPQVDKIFIIDNSIKENHHNVLKHEKIKYEYLGENKGIAYAQNRGLTLLKRDNVDFCFFLDQDSIIEPNMVQILVQDFYYLTKKGYLVGAIGPRPINRQLGKEYKGSVKKGTPIEKDITEVSEIISSASLIPSCNFEKVGKLDDSLFIDGVDHEWCWRCTNKIGARFFISEKTHLSHQLGEGDKSFLWLKVAIPTPFRTYYQYRNYFILLARPYVPVYWKLSNGVKYFIKLFYYPLFISPRKKYLKNICKGIYSGINMMLFK